MNLAERLTLSGGFTPSARSPREARRGVTGVAVPPGVAVFDVELKLRPAEDEPTPYIRSLAIRRACRSNQ
jgi:hypothetical protein